MKCCVANKLIEKLATEHVGEKWRQVLFSPCACIFDSQILVPMECLGWVALRDPGWGPRYPQCPKCRGWLRSKLLKVKLVTEEGCKNEDDYFAYLGFPLTHCFLFWMRGFQGDVVRFGMGDRECRGWSSGKELTNIKISNQNMVGKNEQSVFLTLISFSLVACYVGNGAFKEASLDSG